MRSEQEVRERLAFYELWRKRDSNRLQEAIRLEDLSTIEDCQRSLAMLTATMLALAWVLELHEGPPAPQS